MRPSPFRYERPETLEEARSLLSEHGADARIIAGGQSLVPMMNFRLAEPRYLVDVNRVPELQDVTFDGESVRLGALTRYVEIEYSTGLTKSAPLLVQAMPLIAHSGIRNRGTIGGSVALADPSAEMPACCLALDARIALDSSRRGPREVMAADFFKGIYSTDAADDEIVTDIRIAAAPEGRCYAIHELAARHGDFALAGAVAAATLTNGRFEDVRLVFFAVADAPTIPRSAQNILEGATIGDRSAIDEAAEALSEDIDFKDDQQLSSAQRRLVSKAVLSRLIEKLNGQCIEA
jgi:aerobic carbon-monoxide dehydrogenase medium subunit